MIGVGDLVVCVDAEPQPGDDFKHPDLGKGRVYTISGVHNSGPADRCPIGVTLVEIEPINGRTGFCADRFRKIQHDKREACEAEFVTLLNRTKLPMTETLSRFGEVPGSFVEAEMDFEAKYLALKNWLDTRDERWVEDDRG